MRREGARECARACGGVRVLERESARAECVERECERAESEGKRGTEKEREGELHCDASGSLASHLLHTHHLSSSHPFASARVLAALRSAPVHV